MNEGRLAAASVLADARATTVPANGRLAALRSAVDRQRAFARAMALAHPVPPAWSSWLTDETVVCRCEEVTAGAIRTARADGAPDHRQIKQRPGPAWAGARGGCADPPCTCLTARHRAYRPAERLAATPVTLRALADLDEDPPPIHRLSTAASPGLAVTPISATSTNHGQQ
ncbi:hypothetical protein ACQ9NK_31125 [Streptomyces lividans]